MTKCLKIWELSFRKLFRLIRFIRNLKHMTTIIPAILSTTEEDYRKDIENVNDTPSLEGGWVHVDFMDGVFVDNKSIDVEQVIKCPTTLKKEAHLMVMQPLHFLDNLIEAGFERVIVHFEAEEVEKCIEYLHGKGIQVGLAVKVGTDLEKAKEYLSRIDVLLIMSVEIGHQGQPFMTESIDKIKESLRLRNVPGGTSLGFKIAVDGAVSSENIGELVLAGAEHLSVGSHLVKGNVEENLEKLWEGIYAKNTVDRLIHPKN